MIGPPVVDGAWQRSGCGDRCIRLEVPLLGSTAYEIVEAHDPDAHEEYVWRLLTPHVVRTGLLTVDIQRVQVWVGPDEVPLYGASWRLLRCLAEQPGRVVSPRALVTSMDATALDASSDGYLRAMVTHVRRRLGVAGELIENRPWLGYMLRADPPTTLEHAS